MNKAVRVERVEWSLVNDGSEMRESHGLETDLNRRMDSTGSLERMSSTISIGTEIFAFLANRSSVVVVDCSRVSIFSTGLWEVKSGFGFTDVIPKFILFITGQIVVVSHSFSK
ncbi:hypothetical protein Hanom_Chr13g01212861 [Helianthus anomalus]